MPLPARFNDEFGMGKYSDYYFEECADRAKAASMQKEPQKEIVENEGQMGKLTDSPQEADTRTEKRYAPGRAWDFLVAEDLQGRGIEALRHVIETGELGGRHHTSRRC